MMVDYHGQGSPVGKYFFFQAEDGIRDLVRSRWLGYVYKRQKQVKFAQLKLPWLDK